MPFKSARVQRLPRPVRELKGFAKVSLAPGEATRVTIELPPRAFAYYDVGDSTLAALQSGMPVPSDSGHARRDEAGWYVDPGEYRILVGRSSAELGEAHILEITGDALKLPS